MDFISFFAQLFVIAFGVFAALVLAFYIIWPKIENYLLKMNSINQMKSVTKDTLQLKFAAYERLILFAYRISPNQVLLRNYNAQWSIDELKNAIIADIDNEFQHNFTQQLYVSVAAWQVVKDLKENTVLLVKNTRNGLGPQANVDDFAGVLLKHVSELELNPYDAAQVLLKNEVAA